QIFLLLDGLDDERIAFLTHDSILARKLEFPGDANGLIAAVAEQSDVALGAHASAWHMSNSGPNSPARARASRGRRHPRRRARAGAARPPRSRKRACRPCRRRL